MAKMGRPKEKAGGERYRSTVPRWYDRQYPRRWYWDVRQQILGNFEAWKGRGYFVTPFANQATIAECVARNAFPWESKAPPHRREGFVLDFFDCYREVARTVRSMKAVLESYDISPAQWNRALLKWINFLYTGDPEGVLTSEAKAALRSHYGDAVLPEREWKSARHIEQEEAMKQLEEQADE